MKDCVMRFSDFVVYHALQENNRCLHLLSAYPAPLSDTSVHSLRIGVKLHLPKQQPSHGMADHHEHPEDFAC